MSQVPYGNITLGTGTQVLYSNTALSSGTQVYNFAKSVETFIVFCKFLLQQYQYNSSILSVAICAC